MARRHRPRASRGIPPNPFSGLKIANVDAHLRGERRERGGGKVGEGDPDVEPRDESDGGSVQVAAERRPTDPVLEEVVAPAVEDEDEDERERGINDDMSMERPTAPREMLDPTEELERYNDAERRGESLETDSPESAIGAENVGNESNSDGLDGVGGLYPHAGEMQDEVDRIVGAQGEGGARQAEGDVFVVPDPEMGGESKALSFDHDRIASDTTPARASDAETTPSVEARTTFGKEILRQCEALISSASEHAASVGTEIRSFPEYEELERLRGELGSLVARYDFDQGEDDATAARTILDKRNKHLDKILDEITATSEAFDKALREHEEQYRQSFGALAEAEAEIDSDTKKSARERYEQAVTQLRDLHSEKEGRKQEEYAAHYGPLVESDAGDDLDDRVATRRGNYEVIRREWKERFVAHKKAKEEYQSKLKAHYDSESAKGFVSRNYGAFMKATGRRAELPAEVLAAQEQYQAARREYAQGLQSVLKMRGEYRTDNQEFDVHSDTTKAAFGSKFIIKPGVQQLKIQRDHLRQSEVGERSLAFAQKIGERLKRNKWRLRIGAVTVAGGIGFATGGISLALSGAGWQATRMAAAMGGGWLGGSLGHLSRRGAVARAENKQKEALENVTKKFSVDDLETLETALREADTIKDKRLREQKVAMIIGSIVGGGSVALTSGNFIPSAHAAEAPELSGSDGTESVSGGSGTDRVTESSAAKAAGEGEPPAKRHVEPPPEGTLGDEEGSFGERRVVDVETALEKPNGDDGAGAEGAPPSEAAAPEVLTFSEPVNVLLEHSDYRLEVQDLGLEGVDLTQQQLSAIEAEVLEEAENWLRSEELDGPRALRHAILTYYASGEGTALPSEAQRMMAQKLSEHLAAEFGDEQWWQEGKSRFVLDPDDIHLLDADGKQIPAATTEGNTDAPDPTPESTPDVGEASEEQREFVFTAPDGFDRIVSFEGVTVQGAGWDADMRLPEAALEAAFAAVYDQYADLSQAGGGVFQEALTEALNQEIAAAKTGLPEIDELTINEINVVAVDNDAHVDTVSADRVGVEPLPPYTVEGGDNLWDVAEGDTNASRTPTMERVPAEHRQALIDLARDRINADSELRTALGAFGDSADVLREGETLHLDRLDELFADIATEQGWLDGGAPEAADSEFMHTVTDADSGGVISILEREYPETFAGLSDEQRWRVYNALDRSLAADEGLLADQLKSGDADVIQPGERIDLSATVGEAERLVGLAKQGDLGGGRVPVSGDAATEAVSIHADEAGREVAETPQPRTYSAPETAVPESGNAFTSPEWREYVSAKFGSLDAFQQRFANAVVDAEKQSYEGWLERLAADGSTVEHTAYWTLKDMSLQDFYEMFEEGNDERFDQKLIEAKKATDATSNVRAETFETWRQEISRALRHYEEGADYNANTTVGDIYARYQAEQLVGVNRAPEGTASVGELRAEASEAPHPPEARPATEATGMDSSAEGAPPAVASPSGERTAEILEQLGGEGAFNESVEDYTFRYLLEYDPDAGNWPGGVARLVNAVSDRPVSDLPDSVSARDIRETLGYPEYYQEYANAWLDHIQFLTTPEDSGGAGIEVGEETTVKDLVAEAVWRAEQDPQFAQLLDHVGQG